jgi:hypothetical protein
MLFKKIKMHAIKYFTVVAAILMLFTALVVYVAPKTSDGTFINSYGRVAIADNDADSCRVVCPTEKQVPFYAHIQGHRATPSSYGLAPPSVLLVLLIIVLVSSRTTGATSYIAILHSASRQRLYGIWRI